MAVKSNSQDSRHLDVVRRACSIVDANEEKPPSLTELGRQLDVSPHHLQRIFKQVVGISPRQYGEARRLGRFKHQLKEGETIASALYGAGFGSTSRLYEKSSQRLGMTPARYKDGGKGADIGYSIASCALGRVLIAATLDGLCFLGFDDSASALEAELTAEFPAAKLTRRRAELEPIMAMVLDLLEGHATDVSALPLDVQATAFQGRVWDCLMRIPAGGTLTYQEIAQEIGSPAAARAVGHACATNPVSLVIPCHRAVGSDGKLHGYRWGLHRKEGLLVRERANSSS